MEQYNYTRGGKRYQDFTGLTAAGMPVIYMDALDLPAEVSKGQLVRDAPEKIIIEFTHDAQGRAILSNVHTKMKRYLIANNGDILAATAYPLTMSANPQDKLDFVGLFWEKAKRFIINGRIRKMLGFNYLPYFITPTTENPAGIAEYTAEQLAAAPTDNYDTHTADGNEINSQPAG